MVSPMARTPPPADTSTGTGRITSLDILRGVVMVLMAIDHVRCYAGVPAGGPTAGLFFTRWVTHFCAPVFVFLAGTGAFLHGQAAGDRSRLQRYLVTRGLMLVALELTIVRFSWTFNFEYTRFTLFGVIWMLGWCMVLLAGLVRWRASTIGWLGLGLIVLQPIFSYPPRLLPASARHYAGWIWEFIYPAGIDTPEAINALYTIVPWIGVMAAGYAFGAIVSRARDSRSPGFDRWCLRVGLVSTALFLVAGGLLVFLAPADADAPPALFRLLNQQKYPASPLYLLMTLGPAIALLPFAGRARGRVADVFATFGRVPMFYYLLHIPAIHLAALAVMYLRGSGIHHEWYATAPYTSVPDEHQWSLPLLYLVFVVVVAVLYLPCRWYAREKARRVGGSIW